MNGVMFLYMWGRWISEDIRNCKATNHLIITGCCVQCNEHWR